MNFGRFGGSVAVAVLVLLTASPAPPGRPASPRGPADAPLTIYGKAGTFGVIGETVPSGQEVNRVERPGWRFAQGRRTDRSVVAADGSILTAGLSFNDSHTMPTSGEMVIGAYDPVSGGFDTIRITTTKGREFVTDTSRYRVAPTVSDLLALPGGAVAFTAWPAVFPGQDLQADGEWPVLGVLTKVDGKWVAPPDKQWTASALGLHPQRMARLSGSGDIIAAQADGPIFALRFNATYSAIQIAGSFAPKGQVRELFTDPSGVPGDERFAAVLETPGSPAVVQEFRYDGQISPRSGPVLAGGSFGFGAGLYDRDGNLWITRWDGKKSGPLAIYRKGKLAYEIVQARALRKVRDIIADAATGTVAVLGDGGVVLTIRALGDRFAAGNPVDLGHKLLATTEVSTMHSRLAGMGPGGRLWVTTSRVTPSATGVALDHWLMSLAVHDLFTPKPIRLPHAAGQAVIIQAERTITTGAAFYEECAESVFWDGCAYDGVPGHGFFIKGFDIFGIRDTFIEYLVEVPADGSYRLSYHVTTFPQTTEAQIELSVAGHRYVTPVYLGGTWGTVKEAQPVQLTAGLQTIRLTAGPGQGGWFLNSLTLQRL